MFDAHDDASLVALTLAGRTHAFTELARRHQDYAYSRAFGVLADFHLAHDVVQEALLAAYQDLPKLQDPHRFRAWLSGIVRHMAHRALRELGRVNSLAEALVDASDLAERPPRPDGLIEREELRQQVQAALGRLSGTNRQVATLYYMDGLSYADVAGLVGVSKTVVQGRLQRARAQLRRDLGAFEERLRAEPLPQDFSANVGRLLDTAVSQRADRAQASKRLTEMGVGAVLSLCEALDGDTSDAVRLLAGRVLAEIGDPRAVQPLLRLLYTHRGRGLRYWTSRGFQADRLLAIPGMRQRLLHTLRTETDKGTLWLAFGILSDATADGAIFDGMHDVFRDPEASSWTRAKALTTLVHMRPDAAPWLVEEAITQQDDRIRGAGARLAIQHGLTPSTVVVCRALFADMRDWEGRLCAARLLLAHGPDGRAALARYMRSGSPGERAVSAIILAQAGCEEAAQVLDEELFLEDRERCEFREAVEQGRCISFLRATLERLARENPTRVGPLVEGFLEAGNPGLRVAAIKIIFAQRGAAFLDGLRAQAKCGGKVARAAVSAMVKLKDTAKPVAEDMTRSADPQECRAGAAVLRRLPKP